MGRNLLTPGIQAEGRGMPTANPEPQNSQSDYFYCLTLSGGLFFSPFSLMKLAWWSWASGYQTHLSLCFVERLLPD